MVSLFERGGALCATLLFSLTLAALSPGVDAQTISAWLTRGDQSAKLAKQADLVFSEGSASGSTTIAIDPGHSYQLLDGFGFTLTQGSAELVNKMSEPAKGRLLNELFSPTAGNALSVLRISIGASDLSSSLYTCNESVGDVSMLRFSLGGPDNTHLIPVLKKIKQINPDIKILATPWTAPTWMKSNGAWVGGSLRKEYYGAYAAYFVKYLQAMHELGLPIWAITPQNEPENLTNEPSMGMSSAEQLEFINNHLGPALQNARLPTKIIAFDHNCDNTQYPIDVLNNSRFVDGAAFHLYGGDVSAMSAVRNATNKNVYLTEQFTSSNGSFNSDLGWHMENVVIGSLRNWSRSVIEWSLASDPKFGPRTPGGCSECLGAVTIKGDEVTRNISYYIISQLSRFTKPNAKRIESNQGSALLNVALQNTDNSYVLLTYNKTESEQAVAVNWSGRNFRYTVPPRSAVTFTWLGTGGGSRLQ